MKKNLTYLTGIVIAITILLAGGCCNKKTIDSTAEGVNDSTTVRIYLKDLSIDGEMHLEMYDSRKPGCEVIDNLVTVAYYGDTVIWDKAHKSQIKEIKDISLIDPGKTFNESISKVNGLWTLIIPTLPEPDTLKYEIAFTVKNDTSTYVIDPYIRIPGGRQ